MHAVRGVLGDRTLCGVASLAGATAAAAIAVLGEVRALQPVTIVVRHLAAAADAQRVPVANVLEHRHRVRVRKVKRALVLERYVIAVAHHRVRRLHVRERCVAPRKRCA